MHRNRCRLPSYGQGLQLELMTALSTDCLPRRAADEQQKELVSLILDIGGGTTEYVVYPAASLSIHGGSVGGDHVSTTLAYRSNALERRSTQSRAWPRRLVDDSIKGQTRGRTHRVGLPGQNVQSQHLAAPSGGSRDFPLSGQTRAAWSVDYLRAEFFFAGRRGSQIHSLEQVRQMPVSGGRPIPSAPKSALIS